MLTTGTPKGIRSLLLIGSTEYATWPKRVSVPKAGMTRILNEDLKTKGLQIYIIESLFDGTSPLNEFIASSIPVQHRMKLLLNGRMKPKQKLRSRKDLVKVKTSLLMRILNLMLLTGISNGPILRLNYHTMIKNCQIVPYRPSLAPKAFTDQTTSEKQLHQLSEPAIACMGALFSSKTVPEHTFLSLNMITIKSKHVRITKTYRAADETCVQ